MLTVPLPLCWKVLSLPLRAPPPMTYDVPPLVCKNVAASSPMSFHHTLRRVQVPRQCTPSPAGGARMTFCQVPPLAISNIGSWLSDWLPSPMQQYVFIPPSNVPETLTVPEMLTEPADEGHAPVGVLPPPPPP